MRSCEAKVPVLIKDALNYLEAATHSIDNIKQEARTPEVDILIREAADSMFEAKEFLNKIDLEQYNTRAGGFVSENIRIFRHRKNKVINKDLNTENNEKM